MKTRLLFACLLAVACSQAGSAKPAVLAVDRAETQASATFGLTSRDFVQDGEIPLRFSDYGDSLSPSLAWSGLPAGTKSLAIMMEDPDAVSQKPFVHWLAWNLDPKAGRLERGSVSFGARMGRNGRGNPSYFGPHPSGKNAHHYHFQIFALDSELPLKAGASREQLLAAMKGHVLAKADLVGLFTQPKGR
ncbi:MAG TPA: YbhB/YbcL family Raf kinase inhibitor-like protein [Allosphingosinicella sp.]|nr:YbhB/YbcL family Raf kinase inhibitor-like protein [Allosphingosinicella sp.]